MLKNYIRQLLIEILKEPEVQVDLVKFKINIPDVKRSVWDIIKTQELDELCIRIIYFDDMNFEREFKIEAQNIPDLLTIVNHKAVDVVQSDLRYVKSVHFQVWYNYKGKRELEAHNFMDWRTKKYSIESIDEVFKEIKTWIKNHPEYLL